jgi:hypothetical protein
MVNEFVVASSDGNHLLFIGVIILGGQFVFNYVLFSIVGAAGKTTLATHCLKPLIPNSVLIEIEDWNTVDGSADSEIRARDFYKLAAQLNTDSRQSFILDIGASNSKIMSKHFEDLELTREIIDWWIVPVRAGAKERVDTLKSIDLLLSMSIQPSKIIVIAQAVDDVDQFDSNFENLNDTLDQLGIFFASQAVLYNEVFNLLKNSKKSVFEIASNMPDFASMKIKYKNDEKKLLQIGHDMLIFSLACKASRNLLSVFDSTPMSVNYK